MTQITETDLGELKDLILGLDKKIEALDKKIDVGFANVDTKFAEVKGEIKALDTKFDERIKNLDQRLGSGEFISRGIAVGVTVTIVGGLLLTFSKILFFGKMF